MRVNAGAWIVICVGVALGCSEDPQLAPDACGGCGSNATCVSGDGGAACVCHEGFYDDGTGCQAGFDPSECGGCDQDARCLSDEAGDKACRCGEGFVGDGKVCIGTLDPSQCGGCAANADCLNEPFGAVCRCREGFTGDGRTCEETLRSATCEDTCDANAECVKSANGRPVCRCVDGWTGNGLLCTKIVTDEDCGGCHDEARCVQTEAGYECRCRAGLLGDGKSCRAPDSCDDENGGCHPKATCSESAGALSCECAHGFSGDGYACLPPVGGYVRLKGQVSVDYSKDGCLGNAVWEFDLPLVGGGDRYATNGTVETAIWTASASVDFLDFDTGEILLDFQAHTWLEHTCPGRIDFLWTNAKDGAHTWIDLPSGADLVFFGDGVPWYWSANDVTLSNVQSTLTATFVVP